MTVADFLGRLQRVRRCGSGWEARCPAHEDGEPSLSVAEGSDGRILLKCFAGCSPEAIVAALGLAMADLFADAPRGTSPARWTQDDADHALALRGLRPATISYFRIVADLKRQAWAFPLGRGRPIKFKAFEAGHGRPKYWTDRGATLGVYHLAPCRGQAEAWLAEGESDTWIAHQAGVPAFSLTGGAGNVNAECAEAVRQARIGVVHVVYDRDDPGREGARKVAEALAAAGQTVTVRDLPTDVGPGGDVTGLYNHLGADDAAFRAALAALPMRSVGGPETKRERNARIRTGALTTLREVQRVGSWPWGSVGRLLGGLVADWVYAIGALTGNGKTTVAINLLDHLWEHRVPSFFLGTEMPAEDLLKRWAAMRLGLDEQTVFDGGLSADDMAAMEAEVVRINERDEVTFSTEVRLNLGGIVSELAWACDPRTGPRPQVVFVDHVHELSQDRKELDAICKELKALARERHVALIVCAQLNRDRSLGLLDDYTPPSISRFKASSTIGEVSDIALGLFRPLRQGITGQQRRAVQHGELQPSEIAEPNAMAVACLKHRYRGSAKGQFVRLALRGSRLESQSFAARVEPPAWAGDAREPEDDDRVPF